MTEIQNTPWDRQCLEALKSLGKTLGQMTLYKIGHPAVAATLEAAREQLTSAMGQAAEGEVSYSVDVDKVICNGRIIGLLSALPNAIGSAFNRFKVGRLSFQTGFTPEELAAFCELVALRPAEAPSSPQDYLAQKGVSHIVLHEAAYARVEEEGAVQEPALAPQPLGDEIVRLVQEEKSVNDTIRLLVDRAVADPAQRGEIFGRVIKLLEKDIERRIEEAVRPLREERTRLSNEQERTQGVISNMLEGVVMVDEQGKILMMNPAAEQIYGATLGEVAGTSLADRVSQEMVMTLASEIGTPSDREIKKDVKVAAEPETRRAIQTSGAVVQNEAGKVVGLMQNLTDVAKYRELQRMQRDFIAHVTHELRAPLSSIRAALEILQGEVAGKIKEDENRMLAAALKNSDRLADLINNILDFSKIESGQMTVYPKKADAEKIARDGVDSLAAWAAKKRVSLSLVSAPSLPLVMADAQRTTQVLINLISNSIKFTPVGGRITVHVLAETGPSVDKFVQFSVTDTGSGIPKADQKKIFEKFVQIASGEMHVGGTGLGLAIAKALVHLQGGRMWVESEPGKGATFFFTLPVYVAARESTTPAAAAGSPQKRPWWKRILGLR